MPAKVICNFRMFGSIFEGLLESSELEEDYFYWITSEGTLKTIDCLDKEPIDEDTDRYEFRERFKLAATGFYGDVVANDFSGSIYLYPIGDVRTEGDPCVNAVFTNGELSGFAVVDHQ